MKPTDTREELREKQYTAAKVANAKLRERVKALKQALSDCWRIGDLQRQRADRLEHSNEWLERRLSATDYSRFNSVDRHENALLHAAEIIEANHVTVAKGGLAEIKKKAARLVLFNQELTVENRRLASEVKSLKDQIKKGVKP